MNFPDFSREEKLYKKGYKTIAGIDEAGRGPIAGPVVAAAVIFAPDVKTSELVGLGVRDSKLIGPKRREYLYGKIIENCIDWSVSVISEEVIDEINILKASLLAMRNAVESLKNKPDFLIIDGNFVIDDFPVSQLAIPKADRKIFSVSAASIVAKVTRDRILLDIDKEYPQYGFAKHKGYGTREHFDAVRRNGPCKVHRKSFSPISEIIKKFTDSGLAK